MFAKEKNVAILGSSKDPAGRGMATHCYEKREDERGEEYNLYAARAMFRYWPRSRAICPI
jgi:hypothetical protein